MTDYTIWSHIELVQELQRRDALLPSLYDAHVKELERLNYAESANIGWVETDDSIMSKVYTNPRQYLLTRYKTEIVHELTNDND